MKIHLGFHVFLLEPYHVSPNLKRIMKPLSPIEVNGVQKYEVEEIFDYK
jgi:hypothetical protein